MKYKSFVKHIWILAAAGLMAAVASFAVAAEEEQVQGPGAGLAISEGQSTESQDVGGQGTDSQKTDGQSTDGQKAEGQGTDSQEKAEKTESEKFVLVVGQGGSKVKVSYYEKETDGSWKQQFATEGVYGRNGGTYEKAEGDGKTPYGLYGIDQVFGIQEDPGTSMPYTRLTDQDYWVDDPASSHYNRMVNTAQTEKDWNSAEHLIDIAPYYDYVLALDYNKAAVPGKGSAIFIHCTAEGYTGSSGCICIGEEEMKTLAVRADETMKVLIVPDEQAIESYKETT